jgi:hypothetical protein
MEGVGNLFGETTSAEQRLRIARVQAFVVAAEGMPTTSPTWSGARRLSSFGKSTGVRRVRGPGDQALERLGLQMTDEQHRLGRAFADTVASRRPATLAAWGSADSSVMPELEEPTLWLARMA